MCRAGAGGSAAPMGPMGARRGTRRCGYRARARPAIGAASFINCDMRSRTTKPGPTATYRKRAATYGANLRLPRISLHRAAVTLGGTPYTPNAAGVITGVAAADAVSLQGVGTAQLQLLLA